MKLTLSTLALSLLLPLEAGAIIVVPCAPPPDVHASISFTNTESQIQAILRDGGVLKYGASLRNDSGYKQAFGLQILISAIRPGSPPESVLFMEDEMIPVVAPGESWLAPRRTLLIPPGLSQVCVTLTASNFNLLCGRAQARAWNTLTKATACAAPVPVSCVASSTCGPYSICWDHQPSFDEVLAWTDAHCR